MQSPAIFLSTSQAKPGGSASILQMSVPIQPGNSGGPLIDEHGRVVGIVTSTAALKNFLHFTGTLPQNLNWAVRAEYAAAPPWEGANGSRDPNYT